jgi:hypothetical protein
MAIAISAAFILPDLPTNTRGFTKEELEVAQLRMTEDVGEADIDAEEQGPWDGLFMAVKDFKIYIMMITFTAYVVGLSFNAFFVSYPHRHRRSLSNVKPSLLLPELSGSVTSRPFS